MIGFIKFLYSEWRQKRCLHLTVFKELSIFSEGAYDEERWLDCRCLDCDKTWEEAFVVEKYYPSQQIEPRKPYGWIDKEDEKI